MMLFTSEDLRIKKSRKSEDDEEPHPQVSYRTKLNVLRDRLEFMGFTLKKVIKEFEESVKERLSELDRRSLEPVAKKDSQWGKHIQAEKDILNKITFKSWLEAMSEILKNKYRTRQNWHSKIDHSGLPLLIQFMLNGYHEQSIWSPFIDFRSLMRAITEITDLNLELVFDIGDFLYANEMDPKETDLCAWARRETSDEFIANHKIIILTEGNTDRSAIQGALRIFYPHLADYYSFMDFEASRVQGGASALVSVIKSFIGAGIVNRVIALFDNDTAAKSALRALEKVKIPSNFKIMHYPDINYAKHYPTLGPQGVTKMNVNGLAGSIELYFGLDVLLQGDALMPVQWKGYDDSLQQYQGELTNKVLLQRKYNSKINDCENNRKRIPKYDWSAMESVLNQIKHAFHD